jgi:hypothetical protein
VVGLDFGISEQMLLKGVKGRAMWLIIGLVLVVLAASATLLLLSARTPRIAFSPQGLTVENSLFGRTIPTEVLKLAEARVVDLERSPELRPKWRTFGVGLPGNSQGWFRLHNGEKALVFIRSGKRAVRIPTTRGYSVLVEPEDPDAFLAALPKKAG